MGRKVVEFRMARNDVSAIRFGISPGHELCHAVRALAHPSSHPLQWGWLRGARDSVPGEAFELLRLVVGDDGYMPDFLTSPPAWDLTPHIEHERLLDADFDSMVVDLTKRADRTVGRQRAALLGMRDHPARARALIARAWREFWDAALAPHWGTLERILIADIGSRSRTAGTHGVAVMVGALHDSVSWRGDSVQVELSRHEEVLDCRGSGLVLAPSVMSQRCAALTEPPAQPTLFYPALGVTEQWSSATTDSAAAVTALLGVGRGRILLTLQRPLTTSETAATTELAVSTASHHLAVLRGAGLIASRRTGAAVVHERTPLGEALISGSA